MRNNTEDNFQSPKRRRTGCWTCKERRVKCDERQPTCIACARLKLPCQYGMKLLWREDTLSRGVTLGRSGTRGRKGRRNNEQHKLTWHYRTEFPHKMRTWDWLFLNTTYRDFRSHTDLRPSLQIAEHERLYCSWGEKHAVPKDPDDGYLSLQSTRGDTVPWTTRPPMLPSAIDCTPPLGLKSNELYLLNYFTNGLIPRCTTWPADNPFADIILPICFSAPSKPLFNIVMAVACHELSLLHSKHLETDTWVYRAKALRAFRGEVERFERLLASRSQTGWEQTVATLLMLTFFEISQARCSTWLFHQRCAGKILTFLPRIRHLSDSQRGLCRFFCTYFAEHEAFARTASGDLIVCGPNGHGSWFSNNLRLDMTVVDPLLGCSHELISLIIEISDIADEARSLQAELRSDTLRSRQSWILARRNRIERRLHSLQQDIPSSSNESIQNVAMTEELKSIAETRRLSALTYLYSRVDGIPPGNPSIDRLTRQILALIPNISLRSHALLWPLFIVGTMGLGVIDYETGDADKALVLERLGSLQRTRKLSNVGWAKDIVERVWKMRDLRGPHVAGEWNDIAGAGGFGVSLC